MGDHLEPATTVVGHTRNASGWKEWFYPDKSKPSRVFMMAVVLRPLPMEMLMADRALSVLPHLCLVGMEGSKGMWVASHHCTQYGAHC